MVTKEKKNEEEKRVGIERSHQKESLPPSLPTSKQTHFCLSQEEE